MVGSSDRIDGWWSKKLLPPAIQKRARVLVIMKQYPILRERNGASPASEASTPSFALDTAVVVIDRVTQGSKMEKSVVCNKRAKTPGGPPERPQSALSIQPIRNLVKPMRR